MAKLRTAPRSTAGELQLAARRQLVPAYVVMIRPLNTQIKDLERPIRIRIREHPDGRIFLSLFKSPASVFTVAELLAEIGDCREPYPTRHALAAEAGQGAVAIESGRWKMAGFRRACNKRLRVAFCRLADGSRHWHRSGPHPVRPGAPARSRPSPRDPDSRPRAWCRVVWQCWRNHATHGPTRHRALQRVSTGSSKSDYTAVAETRSCPPINPNGGPCGHGVAADGPEAAQFALNAGTDSEMVSTNFRDFGPQLVASGRVPMSRINDAVRRILRVKFRAGLFDHISFNHADNRQSQIPQANRDAARTAADESMVLLKNGNATLPFNPAKRTAVIGPLGKSSGAGVTAPGHDMLGPWWGQGRGQDAVDPYDGIQAGAVFRYYYLHRRLHAQSQRSV
ncbi:MAG: transposase [Solirubrobacteraceae bacterium]